jgi:hypothetical protein
MATRSSALALALFLTAGLAHAKALVLKCPWQNSPNADLLVVDMDASTFQRAVVDAGGNKIWETPSLAARVSESEISATYNDAVYTLNRYSGALSSQFPSGIRTVVQCDRYEAGERKF